jgi:CO/xanthine dehydrogenase FAD-binding subunit
MSKGTEMGWANYELMGSVEETIRRLTEERGRARVVAGGTDLVVQLMEEGQREVSTLLDISQISEIRGITESDGHLLIGAATTISELASSELIWEKARALAQGARFLGSPQIRNVATVGGNVVNAQPAADTSIPLVALGAEAKIVSSEGERWVLVEELFRGVGMSAVDPCRELLTQFRVPVYEPPQRASTMERLARRKAFTLPTLSVAVSVESDRRRERFSRARIVLAPVAPVPWRARRAEEAIKGADLTKAHIREVAAIAREEAWPRESLRGGVDYRKDMVEVLTSRALVHVLSLLKREPHE